MKCKKHPHYEAKRKPRIDCEICEDMWLVAQIQNDVRKIYSKRKETNWATRHI